ncbi:TrkH family potassium uptake protein [Sulfitobacter mediterraneus]|jgi:trk/ktr system potassium uptake protein|uniref:TrkH family potassium uptake protein n=1 Tax=Sulfitobacter TaxID=60136 RepID=UPI0019313195|nr:MULTISPECIES: TrkH family potassium uptake protein [Sulfitobacter]MBM1632539.1 TrkH family potassium uptake protein [Sulfitobacter mediterraneus]MBM1640356.1 TrkH family potassium uptake protein [Sulfitobacter mediterraneus]MBM1644404.1 TrkH family potassium uptake protein [Sulfitobacter mediterraneus]MBM1648451.1 TrkH family potassium uptake protein [Sulfitobacter mediterraneus]MBM1652496.1 TrkH family potassium uptake protein [Sulfitobacter mediterraneus]
MMDLRPVGYVVGLLVAVLGLFMLLPMLVDLAEGRGHAFVFVETFLITTLGGGMIALACSNGVREGLTIQQTFLLTTGVWLMLPLFGALPFILGETNSSVTDAVFEAMSGLTTTGSTVLSGLDSLPKGLLLWRGILQWLGGIGIIVVAMVFLPELKVGGMQIFRSEGFDTFGKILPRAGEIATQIAVIYLWLTMGCILSYLALGMNAFDATVHALTTISTGGFSNYDASFGAFSGPMEYVATVFMILAALPFVRYVQLINGNPLALHRDPQVRGFLVTIVILVAVIVISLQQTFSFGWERSFREALFNITSIISGTGYASVDYMQWGPFAVALFFFIGLIGGCAGSTACSIKIFRYQLLFASIRAQLRRIRSPHGIFTPRYDGRPVGQDVLSSVMSFFMFFVVTMGLVAVALSMTGLDFVTSVSGAAAALANIGPGLGDIIGPAGNFSSLNDTAKWILTAAMLIGRLELMAVYVILTVKFWRA